MEVDFLFSMKNGSMMLTAESCMVGILDLLQKSPKGRSSLEIILVVM